MKLHLTQAAGNQLITGYGDGWVEVNAVRYEQSLVVLPAMLVTDWLAHHDLGPSDLTPTESSAA